MFLECFLCYGWSWQVRGLKKKKQQQQQQTHKLHVISSSV